MKEIIILAVDACILGGIAYFYKQAVIKLQNIQVFIYT
jgi:hypothetical protein